MTRVSSRIDPAALRLLISIAGTGGALLSGLALVHHRDAARQLIDAGLLIQRGRTRVTVAADDLDDTMTSVMVHPITGRRGYLGNTGWQDEDDDTTREIYALDMPTVAGRALSGIDCSLGRAPVPYLDGAVLDFGMARLPRRRARVGIWMTRGLTTPRFIDAFRQLAARRPSEGLRVVISIDPAERLRLPFIIGHEVVALGDVVDHEDGLAVAPDILAGRLLTGPPHKGPVWVSGEGGVLIVHGRWHEFTGTKQKIAVALLAKAWLAGKPVLPVSSIFDDAGCGRSLKRLKDLFSGHPTWHEVIRESGSNCWLEV